MEAKTAVFIRSGQPFELRKLSIPTLKKGEILVKIEYATLCGSDIHTFCGMRKEKSPTILGHEIVGRIVEISGDEKILDLKGRILGVDDRISWAIFASNPEGDMVKKGIPQKEKNLFKYGHEELTAENSLHGGLSEYIILRPHTPIMRISENVPVQVAAIVNCAIATMAGAVRLAGEMRDKRILISGAGMLGMIGCAIAKVMKAKEVVAMDINQERLNLSPTFGADYAFFTDFMTEEKNKYVWNSSAPFDVILELSGMPAATEQVLPFLNIGGTMILVGAAFPQRDLAINAEKIVRNLWTIRGLHNYNREDFIKAVEFIEAYHGEFPFERLIHDQFNLDEVNEAFQYAVEKKPFRVGRNRGLEVRGFCREKRAFKLKYQETSSHIFNLTLDS